MKRITMTKLKEKAIELKIPLKELENEDCVNYLKAYFKVYTQKKEPSDASGYTGE